LLVREHVEIQQQSQQSQIEGPTRSGSGVIVIEVWWRFWWKRDI